MGCSVWTPLVSNPMPPRKHVMSHLGGERDRLRHPHGLTDGDKEKDREHRCSELGEVPGAASRIGVGLASGCLGPNRASCLTLQALVHDI